MLFGRYYHEADSDRFEPIEWLPIAETEKATLYLTKDCIDLMPYSSEPALKDIWGKRDWADWSGSEIRSWLNGYFWDVAFSREEQQRIQPIKHYNENDLQLFSLQKMVEDHIFLLSIRDVRKYLAGTPLYRAELTPFSAKKKEFPDDPFWWWTRTSGTVEAVAGVQNFYHLAFAISDDGREDSLEIDEENEAGIRPAMWVKKVE